MTPKPETIIAKVAAANAVSPMLAPQVGKDCSINNNDKEIEAEEDVKQLSKVKQDWPSLSQEQLNKLLSKIDLSGVDTVSAEEQQEVRALITEFGFLFV